MIFEQNGQLFHTIQTKEPIISLESFETRWYVYIVLLYGNHIIKTCYHKNTTTWYDRLFEKHNLLPSPIICNQVGIIYTGDDMKDERNVVIYVNYLGGNMFYDSYFEQIGYCHGSVLKTFKKNDCIYILAYQIEYNNNIKLDIVMLDGFQSVWCMYPQLQQIEKHNVDITDDGEVLGIVRGGYLCYYTLHFNQGQLMSCLRFILHLNPIGSIVSLRLLDRASFVYESTLDDKKLFTHHSIQWKLKQSGILNEARTLAIKGCEFDYSFYWKCFCFVNDNWFGFLPITPYTSMP